METYKKVYIKSEADLPKMAGSYIVCLRLGRIYEDYKFIGIDNTFPDTNHWLRHVIWYLEPISAVNEPENIPDIDDYPQTDSRTYKNLDGTVNWKKYAMALKSYILNEPKIIPEQECGKPLHEL